MKYVRKNADGDIVAISQESLGPEWTPMSDDGEAVNRFLSSGSDVDLRSSDADFIRVLEDLIDVLVDRNVIRFTDLPPPAQAKLAHRQGMRERVRALRLIDDDESGLI